MKLSKEDMLLYAVTDRSWVGKQSFYEQIEASLKGGVTLLQLREKDLNTEAFLNEAYDIQKLCNDYHVPFIINDDVAVALKCQADGVHIGQSDMALIDARKTLGEDKVIGVSVQTVEQALEAERNGADYLGVGAVFSTSTKSDAKTVSKDMIEAICQAVHIPVVAIGGIHHDNVKTLKDLSIDGIAVVSAIYGADDIQQATKSLKKLMEER